MRHFIAYVISGFLDIIVLLIVVQAIMSWFIPVLPASLRRLYGYLSMATEPFIRPFRRLTQRFTYSTGIDFSPLIAIIAIQLLCRVIVVLLYYL